MDAPESTVPRPRDPAPAFAALMEKIGVTQADLDRVAGEREDGEAFMGHAEFESMRDAEGHTRYANPTDCEGQLRIADDSSPVWMLACDCCRFEVGVQLAKIAPERLTAKLLERANVPECFRGKAFDNADEAQQQTLQACRIWIRKFRPGALAESLPALALYGRAGRGKSHLLSLIVETLINNHGVSALYMSSAELFSEMRKAMDTGSMDLEWQRIVRTPVLALDDLGSMRATPWRLELLLSLLDFRYSHALPLLVATNLPPAAWEREFGDRASSRMRGMMLAFHLDGVDRRAQGVQESFVA